MSKQLGGEEFGGEGRAIEGHQRGGNARPLTVQTLRHQLFARPRFAGDQHRKRRLGQLPCLGAQVHHHTAVAEEQLLAGAQGGRASLAARAAQFRRAAAGHGPHAAQDCPK